MENPLRGIALILVSTFVFSLSDATGKFLTSYLPVTEIAWIRYVIFIFFALALVLRAGPGRFRVRRPGLQILRGLGLVGSALLFIMSLRYLPLADASAIGFISPLLTSALAMLFLREVVGVPRWIGGIVGLIGVLVVVRPGTGAFHPASLLVLLSSLSWALATVWTRLVVGVDTPTATLLWSALTGTAVLSTLLPFSFTVPTAWQLGLLLMLGIIASGGQYLTVLAYRHAAASVLAPFNYVQLLWATALGYAVFSTIPDFWTFVGSGIIVASGLYTLQYERGQRPRALTRENAAPPRCAPATRPATGQAPCPAPENPSP